LTEASHRNDQNVENLKTDDSKIEEDEKIEIKPANTKAKKSDEKVKKNGKPTRNTKFENHKEEDRKEEIKQVAVDKDAQENAPDQATEENEEEKIVENEEENQEENKEENKGEVVKSNFSLVKFPNSQNQIPI